jgi:hypothetical protein
MCFHYFDQPTCACVDLLLCVFSLCLCQFVPLHFQLILVLIYSILGALFFQGRLRNFKSFPSIHFLQVEQHARNTKVKFGHWHQHICLPRYVILVPFCFGFPRGVYVKKKKMGKVKEEEPSKRKKKN